MIRTLVSAQSALARAGLAEVLRGDARLEVIGATTPDAVRRTVAALEPDVVLESRDGGGEVLRAPVVMLVDNPRETWSIESAVLGNHGAYAILSRDASPDEIVAAVVAVAAGLVAVQPRALTFSTAYEHERANGVLAPERLSAREIDVLAHLARGAANKTIAARLGIAENTVKFHVASIFAKLGVSSRTEAVAQGVRLGLVML